MMNDLMQFPLEIKTLHGREFEGHGSVFGNVDLGGDIVMPGAFARSLAQHKANGKLPQMFWMHQMDQVPGKWLEMSEDDRGLKVKGVLADTALGNELRTLMKMEAVRGLSIGYQTMDYAYDKDGNRLLKDVELIETSVVSLAMNPLAEVANVKARLSNTGEYVPRPREFEALLRKHGFSYDVARHVTAKVFHGCGGTRSDDSVLRDSDQDLKRLAKALRERQGMDRPVSTLFED